jgi:copper chaperone CopZ
MKNITRFTLIAFLMLYSIILSAQVKTEPETFKVKVFFHCANGKALLDNRLSALKGVESAVADLETKIVSIQHNPEIISHEKLIEIIEQIGYYTEFSDQSKPINKACNHDHHDGEHDHDH